MIAMVILMIGLTTSAAIFSIAYVIDVMDSPYGTYQPYR
jgi:hypothetical protein